VPHPHITTEPLPTRLSTLLERDEPLSALSQALALARDRGRLVAISGEAGIGKSSLLEAFARRERANAEFLWGGCDALQTPSPLGPLVDMAAQVGGDTAERLVASVPRHDLFAAFVDDLTRRTRPAVVIFEDVHWADEATLDLLKYVGRRIDRTRALLVITWRDDEVDLDHAIHRLLGDWRPDTTLRIQLRSLSVDAVAQLAAGTRDGQTLHALTCGNPFFVTEVLSAADDGQVPITVRDAVLARRASLGVDARAVLDFVSIVPSRAELRLLDVALQPAAAAIEQCIAAGLLKSDPHAVTFRHELARLAVASALPAPRAHACHRRVLDALVTHFDRSAVLARIVHHAVACDAVEVIVEYAPAAARQASRLGAHRQAVQHYRLALEHGDRLADDTRASLLESYAYEHYVTGDVATARTQQREALALWKRLGIGLAIGRSVRWLSRYAWFDGDREEAEACAVEAIDVMRTVPDNEELARAYSNRSQLDMLGGNPEGAVRWGMQAIAIARGIGSTDILSHALNNVGTARWGGGDPAGIAQVEESLELALADDHHEHAARAFCNLVSRHVGDRHYSTGRHWLERGMAYSGERDLDAWLLYMQAWRSRLHAEIGLWPEACADAEAVLAAPRSATVSRVAALAALGRVHARRGDADAMTILDQALELARPTRESQRLIPILTARAELAWLSGHLEDIEPGVREGLDALSVEDSLRDRERLIYWLWKAGGATLEGLDGDGPYEMLMRGEWRRAADYWTAVGCPYEQAEALMQGDALAARRALEIFQTLGAAPAARLTGQRLRQLGAGRLPRGRRPSTRAHPAGLTTRESEILEMLARGLLNPQIAGELFVSRKTVEHHVSSILGKLQVSSREEAVSRARAEGWVRTN
jgi:DNA-binding CsgD family transcriptional regulator/tetratricopeptide (TPR) repeat protein